MTSVFNKFSKEYDLWYEKNQAVYISEISAIRPHLISGLSLEVGVGSGRFAEPLKIDFGLDPSFEMLRLAKDRNIKVAKGIAEKLPFKSEIFNVVLLVVTICFLEDPEMALKEVKRVLQPGGRIIVGFVDKDSFLGKIYLAKKEKSIFYREAKFYSVTEVKALLEKTGFKPKLFTQTIFNPLEEITEPQPVKEGYGEGGFVVISAKKVE
ncbi:methyltransferase [Caldimicrobium thiodismutans]|uniref:Methyltransferase n=1 Tax=Caldimicrobium thiodismutans TaxID=1653476 RepID=A0A0U4W1Z4_9BACT|nr:class I SAM-dependent methyltransferase [Caldimicrobium thiodismutans]BAU23115.1 methyltransferase [Caldimicrobium thiodismutans]